MTEFHQDIAIFRGDTVPLRVSVKDDDGAPYPLIDVTDIQYAISKPGLPGAIISKSLGSGIEIVDPVGGIFEVLIPSTETETPSGKHEHVARITTTSDAILTVFHGIVHFRFSAAE